MNNIENNMENEMKKNNQPTSIFDLFLVLVKYRKILLVGVVLAILFCIGVYLVKPKLDKKKASETVNMSEKVFLTYVVKENIMPYDLLNAVLLNNEAKTKITIQDLSMDYVNKDQYIASVNKKYPLYGKFDSLSGPHKDEFLYNRRIQELWEKDKNGNRKIQIKKESFNNGFSITMMIKRKDIELSKEFMNYIVKDTEANLESYILPRMDDYIKSAERKIQTGEKHYDSDSSTLAVLQEKEIVAKANAFLDSFESFIYLEESPFGITITEKTVNYKKKSIIVIVAVIFVSIVVAFIINAISNLRKDSEATDSFKAAWKAGKFSKK